MQTVKPRLSHVLYERGDFFVVPEIYGSGRFKPQSSGFAVYENTGTHAVRVAQIGYSGREGFDRATAEADRRHAAKTAGNAPCSA